MSWLELDDRVLDHPKFIRAVKLGGSEAVHLWLGIRAYCGQLLTDGFVPQDMIDEVRGPRDVKKRAAALSALVEVRLLDLVPGGYSMHDYLDWSKSRDEVIRRRKDWRDKKKGQRGAGVGSDPSDEMSPGDTLGDSSGDSTKNLSRVPDPRAHTGGDGRGSGDLDLGSPEGAKGELAPVLTPVAPEQRRWPAEEWFAGFKVHWLTYQNGSYGGRPNDFQAIGALREILSRLPLDEALAAQKRGQQMFAEYFSDRREDVANARHPWSWFVQRFDGLRFPRKAAPADDRCAYHRKGFRGKIPREGAHDSCPECRHAQALTGGRTGDVASVADVLATERKVAELRAAAAKEWTPEQRAEMHESLQRDRQPAKAAAS